MKLHNSLLSLIALVALPLVSFAAPPSSGGTSTVAFGGTAIPGGSQSTSYVISASGSYYLAGERVMTAGVPAIVVSAPDVTIDLNGGTIRYTAGSGVLAIKALDCSNVEIRNGSITDVPGTAIAASGGSGLRVRNVRISACAQSGISISTALATIDQCDISYCGAWGIYSYQAHSTRVTNCTIAYNGNTGVFMGGAEHGEVSNCNITFNQVSGIRIYNSGSLIMGNVVAYNNQSKSGGEAGIYAGSRSLVRNNVVDGNFLIGVYVQNTNGQSIIEGNTITRSVAADGVTPAVAIAETNVGSVYVNNRISTGSQIEAGLVNGGGNIIF